ncbi:MAG TPA: hypothetical protein VJ870_20515 [Amycolatopsis sp.]|nr:hypothetical protein [Amycolatopsis sp.]
MTANRRPTAYSSGGTGAPGPIARGDVVRREVEPDEIPVVGPWATEGLRSMRGMPAPAPRADAGEGSIPRASADGLDEAAPDGQPGPLPAAPAGDPSPPRTQERTSGTPTVLTPTTAESKRVGLYLHPDDYRELGLAKVDDGADCNARVRAMIALWRSNERFRNAVDKLARTSPRGPRRG